VWKIYTVLEEPQPTRKNGAGIPGIRPGGRGDQLLTHRRRQAQKCCTSTPGGSATGVEQSLTDAVVAFVVADRQAALVKQLVRPEPQRASRLFELAVPGHLADRKISPIGRDKSRGVVYGLIPDPRAARSLADEKIGDRRPRFPAGGGASGMRPVWSGRWSPDFRLPQGSRAVIGSPAVDDRRLLSRQ